MTDENVAQSEVETSRSLAAVERQSVVSLEQATKLLAQVKGVGDIPIAVELANQAEAVRLYSRKAKLGLDAQNDAAEIKLHAERAAGKVLAAMEKAKPGPKAGNEDRSRDARELSPPKLSDLGVNYSQSSRWQTAAGVSDEETAEYCAEQRANGKEISSADFVAKAKREQARERIKTELESIDAIEAKALEGIYDVIVIDPPWPMQKIDRDAHPAGTGFDYPVMTEEDIVDQAPPMAENCHVWLWTTHKFLPMAFRILEAWTLKYVCVFVWHKPGGFQPFGLPQYNCEFALYARKGSPEFISLADFPVCFNAPRGAHSEKPEQFYEIIRRVTGGRRLDMYSRRDIEGFDGWGKEA